MIKRRLDYEDAARRHCPEWCMMIQVGKRLYFVVNMFHPAAIADWWYSWRSSSVYRRLWILYRSFRRSVKYCGEAQTPEEFAIYRVEMEALWNNVRRDFFELLLAG